MLKVEGCNINSQEPLVISNFEKKSNIFIGGKIEKAQIIIDKDTNLLVKHKNNISKDFIIEIMPDVKVDIITIFEGKQNLLFKQYKIGKNSQVQSVSFDMNSRFTNINRNIIFKGEDSKFNAVHGVIAIGNDEKIINDYFHHSSSRSYSQINLFGVAKDRSKIEINTLGEIENKITGCESHQNQKVIIFDKNSAAEAKPILLIGDGDVKASHASTIGKVDEEHLYYLQSRGVSKREAQQMIIEGLMINVINQISRKDLKKSIFKDLKELI